MQNHETKGVVGRATREVAENKEAIPECRVNFQTFC
jgi:hypothetical protein